MIPDFEAGADIEATVTRVEPFGAFVEHRGFRGLVRIPEISWHRIRHPSDELIVGQKVLVRVLAVHENPSESFSASIRAVHPEQNPWRDPSEFAVGREFRGRVVRILEYGAFVEIKPEVWGLLPRSIWSRQYVENDELSVLVLSVDAQRQKIELTELA